MSPCGKEPYLSEDGEALSAFVNLGTANIGVATAALVREDAPVWLAAYTTPRHEKAVAKHLQVREVEYFLPLLQSARKWKNGCKVSVEFPLFPSYIFVRTARRRASHLLNVPGLIALVGAGSVASAIPDAEMELLQRELPLRKYEPHPYLNAGSKVRIVSGPLTGASGILVRKKSGLRVVISVELIRQAVAVEVGCDEVELLR